MESPPVVLRNSLLVQASHESMPHPYNRCNEAHNNRVITTIQVGTYKVPPRDGRPLRFDVGAMRSDRTATNANNNKRRNPPPESNVYTNVSAAYSYDVCVFKIGIGPEPAVRGHVSTPGNRRRT